MNKFILVEDHALVRSAVSKLIEEKSNYVCAGVCSSIAEAIKTLEENSDGVICLIDLNLGEEDGLDLIRIIKEKYPKNPCIVYSMYSGSGIISQAVAAGAKGYLSKNAEVSELVVAFEKAQNGEFYLEANLTPNFVVFTSLMQSLTSREHEVFDLLLKRKSNNEICEKMSIEKHSVENYLTRIFSKLGVTDREDLVRKFGGGGIYVSLADVSSASTPTKEIPRLRSE